MRLSFLVGVTVCSLLMGCSQATLIRKFTPQADEAAAREYAQLLQQGQFAQIEHDLDPSLVDRDLPDTFSKMAALFPADTPISVKVVEAHTYHARDLSTSYVTLEYQFPTKWLLVNVVIRKDGEVSTLLGMHVNLIPDSLENLNRFTLVGKSALQYAALICALGSFLFTLYVLAICIRSRDMKPKWLWSIVVLVGVGYFGVNWTTGQWTYQLLAISIPCFSMSRPFYGPWTVAAYFPLGAIAFLQRRWRMKITGESIPDAPKQKSLVPD